MKLQLSTQLFDQPYLVDKLMNIILNRAYFALSEYVLSFFILYVVFEILDSKVIFFIFLVNYPSLKLCVYHA